MKKKQIKRITLGGIISWILGVSFVLSGVSYISDSFLAGFTYLIMGIVLLPPMNKLFKEKLNFEFSRGMKIAIIVIGALVISTNTDVIQKEISQEQTKEISKTASIDQEAYYAGDRVEIGNFAYTINSYYTTDKIGQDLMGSFMGEEADGIFLVIDLTIENIVMESKTLWSTNIKAIDDKGRTFDHDSTAEIYLKSGQQFIFEQMQPGLPKSGKIVFDLPKDINGGLKISSDSVWSDEFKIVSWNKKE